MQFRLDRTSTWLCWIMVVTCGFTLVPVGPYGLTGWLAAAGPLALLVWPQMTARHWLTLSLGLMLTFGLLAEPIAWYESVASLFVLLFGTWLVADRGSDLRKVAAEASTRLATQGFREALTRELGRARRHERPVCLFSAAFTQPHTAQCLPHLHAALAAELHIYCQVFVVEGRVLAIVPELAATAQQVLLDRLNAALLIRGLENVHLGCAAFPQMGLTSAALIHAADTSRRARECSANSQTQSTPVYRSALTAKPGFAIGDRSHP